MRLRRPHLQGSLRVCFFGTYDSTYPGNQGLIAGLRQSGVEVIECHVPVWEKTSVKDASYFGPVSMLARVIEYSLAFLTLTLRAFRIPRCAIIITAFNGYLDIPLARLIAWIWGAKLVFNPLMSIYDTLVLDRKHFKQGGLIANLILWFERMLYVLPDAFLVDSRVHYQFFADTLRCPWRKFLHLPFGVDAQLFSPSPQQKTPGHFSVLFYGKYQPLQGVIYVVEAAKYLESDPEIDFLLIGHGPTWGDVQKKAQELSVRNVHFVEWVDFERLPIIIAQSDVCLGIFGVGGKVERCVPNKVIQPMAMRKPVITGATQAMREVFTDREQLLFCALGDARSLANAIVELKRDPQLQEKLAEGGYQLFHRRFTPEAIGSLARHYFEALVASDHD